MMSALFTGGVSRMSPNSSFAISGVSFTTFAIVTSIGLDNLMVTWGRSPGNRLAAALPNRLRRQHHTSAAGPRGVGPENTAGGLPTLPELLTADEACALPILLKPRNQTGDDPAKALPVVLLIDALRLHGPLHAIGVEPCRAKPSGELRQCPCH